MLSQKAIFSFHTETLSLALTRSHRHTHTHTNTHIHTNHHPSLSYVSLTESDLITFVNSFPIGKITFLFSINYLKCVVALFAYTCVLWNAINFKQKGSAARAHVKEKQKERNKKKETTRANARAIICVASIFFSFHSFIQIQIRPIQFKSLLILKRWHFLWLWKANCEGKKYWTRNAISCVPTGCFASFFSLFLFLAFIFPSKY